MGSVPRTTVVRVHDAHLTTIPVWRRVVALADLAMPQLLALWRRLLRRARSRIGQRHLTRALATHLLEADSYVAQVLEREIERPAREALLALGVTLFTQAAEAAQTDIEQQTGVAVAPVLTRPEVRYPLTAYIGEQVRLMATSTRRALLTTVRTGTQAGLEPHVVAREVREVIGLTPRQVHAREALRTRLEAEGLDPEEVRSRLMQATERALDHRAQLAATTQAVDIAQLGLEEAWQDLVRRGVVEGERIRKYWVSFEDARVCPGCHRIAAMHPHGVGLAQPFVTPWGPVMRPTAHVLCRCSLDYRIIA